MRQIFLDTETTGLFPDKGHRIIEIGCVEMINRRLTGDIYHTYLNPERDIEAGAKNITGISEEFLLDKPRFSEIVSDFKCFIEGAELIIHNAPFDIGFIEHELALVKDPWQDLSEYCKIFDTLALAREKHPGQKNNLDALCKRYKVNNTKRTFHGALLDANILADVYLAMTGGQGSLSLDEDNSQLASVEMLADPGKGGVEKNYVVVKASSEELALHEKMMKMISDYSIRD